jgi:N-acetylglucosamine kinase-like BadF-type ATPase
MILIADCGSTKIEWCLLDNKEIVKQIVTCGMNAIMLTEAEIEERLRNELSNEVCGFNISDVYFYGAGCISDDICNNVAKAIRANIPTAKNVEVSTDLLAAARALCGNKPGIACILGTGSNSCYYDGTNICNNVSPLGYILGDEGSGAVLGKILLGDVLKNQLPKHLCEKFLTQYGLDRLSIIRRVYKEPQGNRFMASITPFLIENISEPSIYAIVYNAFKSFFVRNIAQYDGYKSLDVNFIGSIAYYYKDVLEKVAADMDCRIGKILKSPMDGLIQFHTV